MRLKYLYSSRTFFTDVLWPSLIPYHICGLNDDWKWLAKSQEISLWVLHIWRICCVTIFLQISRTKPPLHGYQTVSQRSRESSSAFEIKINTRLSTKDVLQNPETDWQYGNRGQWNTPYINGPVQERCNSSALALELRLSYTNPLV